MYHIGMTSAEQLLALVNDTNELSLTLADIQFGVPTELALEDQEGVDNPANTKLIISARPGKLPVGDVEINYDRIDLEEFRTLGEPEDIRVDAPYSHAKILASFNAFYGANLQLDDIDTSGPVPSSAEGVMVQFKASASSLAYRGYIDILIQPTETPLESVITNRILTGLTYSLTLNPA